MLELDPASGAPKGRPQSALHEASREVGEPPAARRLAQLPLVAADAEARAELPEPAAQGEQKRTSAPPSAESGGRIARGASPEAQRRVAGELCTVERCLKHLSGSTRSPGTGCTPSTASIALDPYEPGTLERLRFVTLIHRALQFRGPAQTAAGTSFFVIENAIVPDLAC